jgi:transcriptional regulator with XRE-family HTH domain
MQADTSTADPVDRPTADEPDLSTIAGRVTFLHRERLRDVTDFEHAQAIKRAGGDASIPRERRPWKLTEIARELRCTPPYLNRIMNGEVKSPGVLLCIGLANLFGVTVAYLIEGAKTDKDRAFEQSLMVSRLIETDAPQSRPLADRLNDLFAIVRPGNGDAEYTNDEVAEKAGTTPECIAAIRAGTVTEDEVSLKLAADLSQVFGAPVNYLGASETDPLVQQVDYQLAMLQELSDTGLMEMALKAKSAEGSDRISQVFYRMGELILHMNSVPIEATTPESRQGGRA